ncbi:carbohydrate binding domain-containing protein [Streptomyces sp. NPDC005480]|uniref:carbohydrate binding domain-containing protein n=1 Tax=Streptomyces sp. NPDC005480 TaxID=3154880 RepID=UPI0033A9FB26
MPFPQTPLGVLVELGLSSGWSDITSDVYLRDKIAIGRGGKDEAPRVDPSSCSLTLNNRAGKYSPRNPLSSLYGQIGRNTPLRVSVKTGSPFLDLDGNANNYAATPDTAALDITGDIDLRWEGEINWYDPAPQMLMGKWGLSGGRSWHLRIQNRLLYFGYSTDGAVGFAAWQYLPELPRRAALRVTVDVDNGAGSWVARHYWAPSINGPWTQFASDLVTAGTLSPFFNSPSPLYIGCSDMSQTPPRPPFTGRCYAAEVRSGINGTIVASPNFEAQPAGTTSFADSAGRTWTVNGAAKITNRRTRFVGEVSSWPARWDVSGKDVYVPVEAAGVSRRLGQGAKALASALRRRVPSYKPLAYWPMEEGALATQATSPIEGVRPLSASGLTWAQNDTLPSSESLPVLASNNGILPRLRGEIPSPGGALTGWSIYWLYRLDQANATERTFLRFTSTGTVADWYVMQSGPSGSTIRGLDADGNVVVNQGIGTGSDLFGQWVQVRFNVTQSGSTVAWQIRWDVLGVTAGVFSASYTGSVGRPTAVLSPPDGFSAQLDGMAIGHISAWSTPETSAYDSANLAWAGEAAGARMLRLAAEESVPMAFQGDYDATERVGPQTPVALLELLDESADADGGVRYEYLPAAALAYRSRETFYNQPVRLALDYAARGEVAPPLEPVDDDQQVQNDVTVQRREGSSARAVLETGALSVNPPPSGVGTYDVQTTLNLYDDDQTEQQAGWRLHLGTVDEARYPTVHVDLAAAPHLAQAVTDTDVGDRVTIANLPAWLPPGGADLIARGYAETIGMYDWDVTYNCTPASPWTVAVADDVVNARTDTDSAQLAADTTSGQTTLSVLTTSGPVWTGDTAETPFDLRTGGEVVRITAPGTLLNANPFFDSDASSWTAEGSTIAWSNLYLPRQPGALGALRITPDGTSASGGAACVLTAVDSVTPGATYVISLWAYTPTGAADLRPSVHWYTNAGTFISTDGATAFAVPAGQWTYLQTTVTAPATAGAARARARHGGTPPASAVWYAWGVRITRTSAAAGYDNFGRTVSGGWALADSGQTWALPGGAASERSVNGTQGVVTIPNATISNLRFQTLASGIGDCEVRVRLSAAQVSTGASMVPGILLRYLDSSNYYRARLHFATGGELYLSVTRDTTQLGANPQLPLSYAAGDQFELRVRLTGHRIQMRVWRTGQFEPSTWHNDVTITANTIATGAVGVTASGFTGNTNTNPAVMFDQFEIVTPQTFTVRRSVNGIAKAQQAGSDVRLATPPIVAL